VRPDGHPHSKASNLPLIFQSGSYLKANISVAGRQTVATIDTGATKSAIRAALAKELDIHISVDSPEVPLHLTDESLVIAPVTRNIDIELGGVKQNLNLIVLRQMIDDVIIGMDFLTKARTNVQIGDHSITLTNWWDSYQHLSIMNSSKKETTRPQISTKQDVTISPPEITSLAEVGGECDANFCGQNLGHKQ